MNNINSITNLELGMKKMQRKMKNKKTASFKPKRREASFTVKEVYLEKHLRLIIRHNLRRED